MAIVTDNNLDAEIRAMKAALEALRRDQMSFSNSFHLMRPKERAGILHKIQNEHKSILMFIEKCKKVDVNNSGTRFALENFKQSFHSLQTLWRKTEKSLENFVQGSAPKSGSPEGPRSETQQAVDQYMSTLRQLGHVPDDHMVREFKSKLETAYTKAKEKAGGKPLEIKIVQEGSKIKVRMEPKD